VTGKKDAKKIRMTRRWFGIYVLEWVFRHHVMVVWAVVLGGLLRERDWKLLVVFGDGEGESRVR
jgi:hypothetical protein